GHCGECHTNRDAMGGLKLQNWLAGAENPEGEGHIPNITPDTSGLGDWSDSDLAFYLESGLDPDYDSVGGSMVKVQENLARLSAEDRAAIVAYLRMVPARANTR
ncbi:MAG TPA: cytochrome c, partial [Xanthomonadales bacterium]|nr:cytochrome c [Xanthomonadales bacterium]